MFSLKSCASGTKQYQVTLLGCGFIGAHVAKLLLSCGVRVVILDRGECPGSLQSKCLSWIKGNVDTTELLMRSVENSDTVFHLFCSTVIGDSITLETDIASSVAQLNSIMEACAQHKVKQLIFVSSSAVYGAQMDQPVSERAPPRPISAYGLKKLILEYQAQYLAQHSCVNCKIIRISNPYGPGQDLNGRQGVIAMWLGRILQDKSVVVRGDGGTVRDYIYIDDVAAGCVKVMQDQSDNLIFNISRGEGVSLVEIKNTFERILQKKLEVEFVEMRPEDIPVSILDNSLAKKVLDFSPRIDLEVGIRKLFDHVL